MTAPVAGSLPDTFELGRRTGREHGTAIETLVCHLRLLILAAFGFGILSALSDAPYAAILTIDVMLCVYAVSLFRTKYRYLLLAHPLIILISSQFFQESFLNLGDGEAYEAVVGQYLDSTTLSFDASGLLGAYGLLGFLKFSSLGVAPTYIIPEYFFYYPSDRIYYLWQGTFHVALCVLVASLARAWHALSSADLFSVVLFAILAPSFFDLSAAPTRHVVTFFGVFLLLVSHIALTRRLSISRVLWFAIATVVVAISKAPLLLPYMLFAFLDLILIQRVKLNAKSVFLLTALVAGAALLGGYLYQAVLAYEEIAGSGARTFSGLTQLPLIGWIVKYVYALLAPFPWTEAPHFIAANYGGNWFLFFMHTLSSLLGLHLFFILLLKWRVLLASDDRLKQMVAYGAIMSLSILRGATGFHTYLLIYFPMFAPLLSMRRFHINPLLPVIFVLLLEVTIILGK